MLRLVGEVLREPSFPASEFELLKQEQLAGIEQQKSEPTQIALHRVQPAPRPVSEGRRALQSDARTSRSRTINAVTLDQVKQLLPRLLRRLERRS